MKKSLIFNRINKNIFKVKDFYLFIIDYLLIQIITRHCYEIIDLYVIQHIIFSDYKIY